MFFFIELQKNGPVAKTDVFINCLTVENANKRVGGPFFLPVFARKAIIQRTKKGLFG